MVEYFNYEKENDILAMHKGFYTDERFKGNVDIGDLILDVSSKGRIVGIEILNASKFLKEFNLKLNDIKTADFKTAIKHNNILISLILKFDERIEPIKIAVPLQNAAF